MPGSTALRLLSALSMAMLITSCGGGGGDGGGGGGGGDGGGGGGGSGGGGTAPPTSSLALSSTNVPDATRYVFSSMEQVFTAADALLGAAIAFADSDQTTLDGRCAGILPDPGVAATFNHFDQDGNAALSVGDRITIEHRPCRGIARNLSLQITSISGSISSLQGNVTFEADAPDGIGARGSFRMSAIATGTTLDPVTQVDLSEIGATISVEGAAVVETLSGGEARLINDQSPSNPRYQIDFSGRINSPSLGGELTFDTAETFVGNFDRLPTSGRLELRNSRSAARIEMAADEIERDHQFDYSVDTTNSGSFSPPTTASWKDVVTGEIFGWDRNVPPRVESFLLAPENPTGIDNITAAYAAYDVEGDPLTYQVRWEINGVARGSLADTLQAHLFEKGDEVVAFLEVWDGRDATRASRAVTIGNLPLAPEVSLLPSSPRTGDTLFASGFARDPDDSDAPTLTYAWLRNGIPLPGETDVRLGPVHTRKGDTITVILTASDGTSTATAQASVVIRDTLPVLSAQLHHIDLAPGETGVIQLVATDVDGDPVPSFVLSHGPTGMQLDPATGEIRWTANDVLFEPRQAYAWAATLDLPGANTVIGEIRMNAVGRVQPHYRSPLALPATRAMVGMDLDGDGDDELLIAEGQRIFELEWDNGELSYAWTYPFAINDDWPFSALTARDIDGDGFAELFVGYAQMVFAVLDGATREVIGTAAGGVGYDVRDVEVADLDGDGSFDIFGLATDGGSADPAAISRLVRFNAATFAIESPAFPNVDYGSSIAVGNVDADDALELVTGGGYVFDGQALSIEWLRGAPFGWAVDVGDVDGDGIDEIIATDGGSNALVYSAVSQSLLWTVPIGLAESLVVGDVVGDARAEIVVGDAAGGAGGIRVYAYDALADHFSLIGQRDGGTGRVPAIAIADVTQNGSADLSWVAAAADSALMVAEGVLLSQEWSSATSVLGDFGSPFFGGALLPSGPDGVPVATFAAFGPNDDLRVATMEIADATVTVGAPVSSTSTDIGAALLADYDLDGIDELIVASRAAPELRFEAYDIASASSEWLRTEPAVSDGIVSVVAGDLTLDGRPDLLSIDTEGRVRAYDAFADEVIWEGPMLTNGRAAEIMDRNGIGPPEIVVAANSRLRMYSADGGSGYELVAESADFFPDLHDAAVGDVDSDGVPEIYVLHGSLAEVKTLDQNLNVVGSLFVSAPFTSIEVRHSGDLRKNLLLAGRSILEIEPTKRREIWRSPELIGHIVRNGIHIFVDPDTGRQRMSIATDRGIYLTR